MIHVEQAADLLDRAVGRCLDAAAARWERDDRRGAVDYDEAADRLEWMAEALEAAADGRMPGDRG